MVKVIKEFRDKETSAIHAVGSEYKGKAARVKQLQKAGYLEEEVKGLENEDKQEDENEDKSKDGE